VRRREPPVAGRYVLLEELGRGATGSVRRARDLRLRREVAVKLLHPSADAAALAGFVREQAHRVRHPHVLAPYGWAAEDDVVLLAMELATGGSLRDRLATGLPVPAVALVAQLLDALAAVHATGLVHGDVKPANLLFRGADHLLLADFGVAARVDAGLVAVGAVGTPAYLPPDRRDGGRPDPSQDVYAAGVLGRRLVPGGPLATLWDSMTRTEPALRPTAGRARRRLRELSGWG
jgi:eukaryotic-like serine/threonine-protein kinase